MTNQEIVDAAQALCGRDGDSKTEFYFSKLELIDFVKEILSSAIPEGHVVVPKEPTMEMCAAGYYTHGIPCAPEIIYRAMIAAAASANKEGT